eukprot:6214725-Pleurochrysis_carterae.AAC.5
MRKREPEWKAVAKIAKESKGTTARKGAMAACARLRTTELCGGEGAEECPGATDLQQGHPSRRWRGRKLPIHWHQH